MSNEADPDGRAETARQLVDGAIQAHKLAPSQRQWAEAQAARDPAWFEGMMKLTPDYWQNRVDALTGISLTRMRLDAQRRAGRDIGDAWIELVLRMKDLARVLTDDIESGLLEPRFGVDRDRLLEDAARMLKRVSAASLDPFAKRQGGRPRVDADAARARLFKRIGQWKQLHGPDARLTNVGLAQVIPDCHPDGIRDDLDRAGWADLDEAELEYDERLNRSAVSATRQADRR